MNQKTLTDIIEEKGSIFKDKKVFDLDYIPEIHEYRDNELKKMAIFSKGIKKGEIPSNMILKGDKATGKTTTIKKFFNLIDERYANTVTVHVNCQIYRTEYKIFSKIFEEMYGYKTSVSGLSTFDIYTKVMNQLVKEDKILIISLDDFDAIKTSTELNRTLYTLLRAYELFNGAKVSVFVTTSNEHMPFLDPSVVTVFHPIEVEFSNYTKEQLYNILKFRTELGFHNGVIAKEVIKEVAQYAHDEGDLRKGIKLFLDAGKKAESLESKKILKKHLN